MNYCIAGFGKVKSASELTSMMNHNLRTHLTEKEKARIDGARTQFNEVLVNALDCDVKKAASFGQKLTQFFKGKDIEVRKDNVLAIDLVLTASPEYFGEWQKNGKITTEGRKKIDQWKKVQLDFLERQFGKGAVKLAVLHLDESSPHLHVVVSPEEKKLRTYKNQHGTSTKECWVLNAKRWGPAYWKNDFLKNYAKANAPLGLKRGVEGSTKKNVPLKDFYAMVADAATKDYKKAIDKMLGDMTDDLSMINTKAGVEKLIKEKLFPKLEKLVRGNSNLKALLKKDRMQEYFANKEIERRLSEKLKEAEDRAAHYGKGLQVRMQLEKEIAELRERNKKLEAELDEVKKKLPPQKDLTNDKRRTYEHGR
jgi:Plasmid recombination enzyme